MVNTKYLRKVLLDKIRTQKGEVKFSSTQPGKVEITVYHDDPKKEKEHVNKLQQAIDEGIKADKEKTEIHTESFQTEIRGINDLDELPGWLSWKDKNLKDTAIRIWIDDGLIHLEGLKKEIEERIKKVKTFLEQYHPVDLGKVIAREDLCVVEQYFKEKKIPHSFQSSGNSTYRTIIYGGAM